MSIGSRPLPSCLGGGDLDGDLYNLIPLNECPEFRPARLSEAASYDPAPKKVLERASTMDDVADFVVDYIYSDVSGHHLRYLTGGKLSVYCRSWASSPLTG